MSRAIKVVMLFCLWCTQVTVTDLLYLFNNLSLASTSWSWLCFVKTLELTIIIKQERVCKDIFTWNMQLSCNRLLPNTYNRILLALTQFIFLQWPYQRVHIFCAPQYTNGTDTLLSENNNNSFSLVQLRTGLCTRWYKREQEKKIPTITEPLDLAYCITTNHNQQQQKHYFTSPKIHSKNTGSWLCQQSRIQSWRWRETKYPNHLPKTTRDQIDLSSMGLQFWYQLLNTWI